MPQLHRSPQYLRQIPSQSRSFDRIIIEIFGIKLFQWDGLYKLEGGSGDAAGFSDQFLVKEVFAVFG